MVWLDIIAVAALAASQGGRDKMTTFKRLLLFLGAMWLTSLLAGAVILWGNDGRFGIACLVAGGALIGSALYSRTG
jgi:hypothetical protein